MLSWEETKKDLPKGVAPREVLRAAYFLSVKTYVIVARKTPTGQVLPCLTLTSPSRERMRIWILEVSGLSHRYVFSFYMYVYPSTAGIKFHKEKHFIKFFFENFSQVWTAISFRQKVGLWAKEEQESQRKWTKIGLFKTTCLTIYWKKKQWKCFAHNFPVLCNPCWE